eukprot:GCRY01003252.1.p1 GENE.GCRY01003252.1~~GCRY01003252.1.p1  ORF type:complete len:211 (-),score=44.48 GCRY01003252.1:214-846(-)
MGLFGKKITPEEQVRKWRTDIRKEERNLERQIRAIQLEENKIKREIKTAAKQDPTSAKMLAKSLVQSRHSVSRLHASKARLHSVSMSLQQNLSMAKMAGSLQKSTEIMACMNRLVHLPEIQNVMVQMQKEMTAAGIIEEMMNDATELEDSDVEEEAEEEIQKILDEAMGAAGPVANHKMPQQQEAEKDTNTAEEQKEIEKMKKRLAALDG